MSNLNPLEQAVMHAFLDGDELVLSILREQFDRANVVKRDFTGVGFYTAFGFASESRRLPGSRSFNLSDVVANVAGTSMGATFLLLVRDGILHSLEGCTYGDETWPEEITTFEIGYRVGNRMETQRDWEALRSHLQQYGY